MELIYFELLSESMKMPSLSLSLSIYIEVNHILKRMYYLDSIHSSIFFSFLFLWPIDGSFFLKNKKGI